MNPPSFFDVFISLDRGRGIIGKAIVICLNLMFIPLAILLFVTVTLNSILRYFVRDL